MTGCLNLQQFVIIGSTCMIANNQMEGDSATSASELSLSALQKLVCSNRLSFIPNLYYQQDLYISILNQNRANFPEQKILVPRPASRHDFLLQQAKQNRFVLAEEQKYRLAICFHLAKTARDEFFKRKVKKEEKYLFHRVAYSQLAEAVKAKFEEARSQAKHDKKQEDEANKLKVIKAKPIDDIFMDKEESEQQIIPEDGDLLGDIFDEPKPEIIEEKQAPPKQNMVEDYISKFNQLDNRMSQCKKVLNRKLCLKRINENLRKRIKSKLNEEAGEKNLNSATVLITSLIGSEPEPKPTEADLLIETPAETEFLGNPNSSDNKSKRKKDESFQLRWGQETLQQFMERNSKFQINKSKYDANYLTANAIKDDQEFEKIFQKNITSREPFPPSINSVPILESKFRAKTYYNTFSDIEYEKTLIKFNRRQKYEKFKQICALTLTETEKPSEEQPVDMSQIYLNPPDTFSNRILSDEKLVHVSNVYQRTNLSKEELLILKFLVTKYRGIFGSNWKIITMLILTNPNFVNMNLTTAEIQELYQVAREQESSSPLDLVNMMNSNVLPCSVHVNYSYEEMKPETKLEPIYQEMTHEAEDQLQTHPDIDLDEYESLISQPLQQHENQKPYVFHDTAKAYEKYIEKLRLPFFNDYESSLCDSVSQVVLELEGGRSVIPLEPVKVGKVNQCADLVLEKIKSQIKFNVPIRKKKNITDRSSELVKILHTLKQKTQQNAIKTGLPPGRPLMSGPVPELAKQAPPSLTPPPLTSAPSVPEAPTKKTLPKAPKTEDKKPPVPKEQKERKKKGGKDGEKQGQ